MYRLFFPRQNISQDKILILDTKQIHHIRDVLRLNIGAGLMVSDDKNNEYVAEIAQFLGKGIILKIREKHKAPGKNTFVTVACAIPKKSKMDDIIDKLTQLGVDKIIPLITERVIVKLDQRQKLLKQRRWEKVAFSASQQSQRSALAVIGPISQLKEVLADSAAYDLKLIPTLEGERKSLKDALGSLRFSHILVLIGPEGDFTPQEISSAQAAGCIPVSLGNLVLRVETAAIAAASFIRLYADR